MAERRVTRSHPDWKKLDELANAIAVATNPQAHWMGQETPLYDGASETVRAYMDLAEPERQALIQILKDKMEEELEGGRFTDFINANPLFTQK